MNDDHDNATTDRQAYREALKRDTDAGDASTILDDAGELHHAVTDGAEPEEIHKIADRILLGALKFVSPSPNAKPEPGQVLAAARRVVKRFAERSGRGAGDGDLFTAMCALDEAIDAHDEAERG